MRCFCCDIELTQTIQNKFNEYTDREITYHLCKLCEKSYFAKKSIFKKLSIQRGGPYISTFENEEIFKELMILGHNMVGMFQTEIRREING